MDILAQGLGKIAAKYGMTIQTCGTNGDFTRYGIQQSGCMTLDILGNANGITFRNLKHKGMRQGCHCIETRDIGAYDTCMNGCKYCYANKKSPKRRLRIINIRQSRIAVIVGRVKKKPTPYNRAHRNRL